jgi:hypothetical protein
VKEKIFHNLRNRGTNRMRHIHTSVLVALLLATTTSRGSGPGTIVVDRNWNVPESTRVGQIVKTVTVKDVGNRSVSFSLENDDTLGFAEFESPFWINPLTGYVYLNKSVEGWVSYWCVCVV